MTRHFLEVDDLTPDELAAVLDLASATRWDPVLSGKGVALLFEKPSLRTRNACEVAIRPIGVGRKNWLFAGSERGGHAAATIYTLIESCRRAGVDPFPYLRDVLVRVATHPASRVHEFVPASWKTLFGSQAARSA